MLGRIDRTSAIYDGAYPDPRSIEILADGNLLFTDRNASMIAEVTPAGEKVWAYTQALDPAIRNPFSAHRFARDGHDYTLIADRVARRVWAVDAGFNVVWQYGVTGDTSTGAVAVAVNHLADPFYARYSPEDGGTVLIADNLRGCRVIEVQYGHYSAGAPDNGFTGASIIWSYGEPGVAGNGPGQLAKPHSAQRLANGNVLICDAGDDVCGARVIEVDPATGGIVWQYGVTGPPGNGDDYLREANFASRLPEGDTLIADTAAHRVLRVTKGKTIEHEWDLNDWRPLGYETGESAPRAAAITSDGRLVAVDTVFQQIVTLGCEGSAQATSLPLDCGHPGVDKAFVSLTWSGDTGDVGTRIGLEYRLNGGRWRPCTFKSGLRRYDFKAGTHGRTIAYRATLSTANRSSTPTLDSLVIQSTKVKTGGNGGGGGGDRTGGSGNSGQSGVYAYRATAQGRDGHLGHRDRLGELRHGHRRRLREHRGRLVQLGRRRRHHPTAQTLDVPIESTGSGSAVAVQGYQVQGEEGVSGVPLRAEQGAQAPEPERPGPPVPVLALIGAGLVVAVAFFVPWPFVAAHLRRITGFDHTGPARFLPFRPLGK